MSQELPKGELPSEVVGRVVRYLEEYRAAKAEGAPVPPMPDLTPLSGGKAERLRDCIEQWREPTSSSTEDSGCEPGTFVANPVYLDKYERLEKLGEGAMGVVYRARQLNIPTKEVAIKFISPEHVRKFRGDVIPLKHPNIVEVYDHFLDESPPFVVMEYIHGTSMDKRLKSVGVMSDKDVVFAFLQIASGVAWAHQEGYVHRDLKPGNILVTGNGRYLVTDFGLSKQPGEPREQSGNVVGTPSYMSPEQARGISDARSDIYSLGVTMYECLTGCRPRPSSASQPLVEDRGVLDVIERPRKRNRRIPKELEAICLMCLQADPVNRYQNAGELEDDLIRFSKHLPLKARPPGTLVRAIKASRRHPIQTATIATTLLFSLVVTTLSIHHAQREQALRLSTEELAVREVTARQAADVAARQVDAVARTIISLLSGDRFRRHGLAIHQREVFEALAQQIADFVSQGNASLMVRELEGKVLMALAALRHHSGDHSGGLKKALRAEEILRGVAKAAVSEKVCRELVAVLNHIGAVYAQGERYSLAIPKFKEAIAQLSRIRRLQPRNPSFAREMAMLYNNLGNCAMGQKDSENGVRYYHQAVEYSALASSFDSSEVLYAIDHIKALSNLSLLHLDSDDLDTAYEVGKEAVALARKLPVRFDETHETMECLATATSNFGKVALKCEENEFSLECYREALGLYDKLNAKASGFLEFRWGQAMSHSDIGWVLQFDDPGLGLQSLQKAEEMYSDLLIRSTGNEGLIRDANENRERLGIVEGKVNQEN